MWKMSSYFIDFFYYYYYVLVVWKFRKNKLQHLTESIRLPSVKHREIQQQPKIVNEALSEVKNVTEICVFRALIQHKYKCMYTNTQP